MPYATYDAAVIGGMAGGATGGFLSTSGNIGDRLGGATAGGLEGGLFGAAGNLYGAPDVGTESYFEKTAVEGLIGGAASAAGGGRFGDGFLGGSVGSLDEPLLGEIGTDEVYDRVFQAMVAATIGGTLSDISGGKFADGAETAAFQNLFNAQDSEDSMQKRANQIGQEITARGYINGKGEADWLYELNGDPNLHVTVQASNLTVSLTSNWVPDPNGGYRATADVTGSDYWVHGQVTVHLRPDGTVGIYDQRYHFEMHDSWTPREIIRNFATYVGEPPEQGLMFHNTAFWIHYQGNVNVAP
jgi:hypothetical protein